MKIEVSKEIDRSVSEVWAWYVVDHVRNHPRWDPDMELDQISDGPIGLGTRIRRRNMRWGTPVDGEMEVVEFERERTFAMSIRDANMQMQGKTTFEPRAPGGTLLTVTADVPGLEPSSDADHMAAMMERSLDNVKSLIEAET